MCRTKRVKVRFRPLGKATQPILLAQAGHTVAPAGQDLVRIALVANVPDQLVAGRIKNGVDRDGEFDDTQRRPKMPARLTDDVNDI